MKGKNSIGQYVVAMVIACLLLAFVGLFCSGTIYADDGNLINPDNSINWIEVGLIIGAAWLIFWPALQKEWASVWSDKSLGTWKKIGYSIAAIASCFVPTIKNIWAIHGGAILALIKTLIRVRLGLPAAKAKVSAAFNARK